MRRRRLRDEGRGSMTRPTRGERKYERGSRATPEPTGGGAPHVQNPFHLSFFMALAKK